MPISLDHCLRIEANIINAGIKGTRRTLVVRTIVLSVDVSSPRTAEVGIDNKTHITKVCLDVAALEKGHGFTKLRNVVNRL